MKLQDLFEVTLSGECLEINFYRDDGAGPRWVGRALDISAKLAKVEDILQLEITKIEPISTSFNRAYLGVDVIVDQ